MCALRRSSDTIVRPETALRALVPMPGDLVPSIVKPLKELRLATFNARAESVAEKPFFETSSGRTDA